MHHRRGAVGYLYKMVGPGPVWALSAPPVTISGGLDANPRLARVPASKPGHVGIINRNAAKRPRPGRTVMKSVRFRLFLRAFIPHPPACQGRRLAQSRQGVWMDSQVSPGSPSAPRLFDAACGPRRVRHLAAQQVSLSCTSAVVQFPAV